MAVESTKVTFYIQPNSPHPSNLLFVQNLAQNRTEHLSKRAPKIYFVGYFSGMSESVNILLDSYIQQGVIHKGRPTRTGIQGKEGGQGSYIGQILRGASFMNSPQLEVILI